MNINKETLNKCFAHHDLSLENSKYHVFTIFGVSICIGCLATILAFPIFLIIDIILITILKDNIQILYTWNFYILYFSLAIPNLLIFVYKILKKTDFKHKKLKFLARYLLSIGLFFTLSGTPHNIIFTCINLIVGGLLFYILRKKSLLTMK